ncbi:MAG: hypothetical protein SXA11_16795 [Cyanobacteriota bacterium]|nr:hypothetical protein [Cyanobacteriota bacterium]
MLAKLLDKLGNWNPQLFREIKGRLTPRKAAIATFLSLIAQGILVFCFWTTLPILGATGREYNRYCNEYKYITEKSTEACQQINWELWWHDIFCFLSWGFLIILVLAGIYMLVADVAKEKRLGTLNFINLSPQSSQKILLGKLLGVPILIYLVIAVAIPLHLWSAYQANAASELAIWYGLLVGISSLFYTASLVFAFLGGSQAWLASILGAIFLLPIAHVVTFLTQGTNLEIDSLKWFFFPELGDAVLVAYGLLLYRCIFRSYVFWEIANRLFRNPGGTILSKKQSYLWAAELQIFVFGFCWSLMSASYKYDFQPAVYFVCIFNLILFLLLIGCLSPHRQALQDWARYKHQQRANANSAKAKKSGNSLISDLIWGEKSPALLAIGINLAISAAIWLPWIFLSRQDADMKAQSAMGLIMTLSLILIYAAIAGITLLRKTKKRALWTVIILGSLLFLLPAAFLLVSPNPETSPFLWLFSPLAFAAVEYISLTTICVSFLAHLSIFGLLSLQLTRKLKKAGESASKSLMSS